MKRKKAINIIVIAVIVIALVAVIGGHKKKAIKADANEIFTVETATPVIGQMEERFEYTGNLEGVEQAMVTSQTAGVVQKVLFDMGKPVRVGQVLAVIENSAQQAAVEQAKAQVMAAETNYEKANKDLSRIQNLYNDKVAPKDNLEMAQLNVKSAYAQWKGAQAGQMAAEKQLSDTYIKSTLNGVVASKKVNLGQTVAPGTEIGVIVNNSSFKLLLMVPENNITRLKSNQPVTVAVDVLPQKEYVGSIKSIGLVPDQNGNSYPVEISIRNSKDNDLKAGMFSRCSIRVGQKNDAMTIPQSAVIINGKTASVYVVENGKAKSKEVQIGLKNESYYEITSGLSTDDKVITIGKELVTDGSLVKVKTGD